MTAPLLRVSYLSHVFPGGKVALRDVDFELGSGVAVVVGPNGAGKTTLLRILAGVLRPTRGEVYWGALPVLASPVAYRDLLGYLPQDFSPYPEMRARVFLAYVARLKGLPPTLIAARVSEVAGLMGLDETTLDRECRHLSHGETRRLGLAAALLNDPLLLLLDEPTSGLDPEGRAELLGLVTDLAAGNLVILSTHLLSDAERIGDHILFLESGRLVLCEAPSAFVAGARGHVFEGTVTADELAFLERAPGVALVARVPLGAGRFRVRLVSTLPVGCSTGWPPGRPLSLGTGLVLAEPGMEDAYVYRRLRSASGGAGTG